MATANNAPITRSQATVCAETTTWTPHRIRELAVAAGVDPRTAARWLRGGTVTSTCAARLERAAASSGQKQDPQPELTSTASQALPKMTR